MILLLKLIILTSMTSLAWKIASSRDMIFEQIGFWAQYQVDEGKKIFELLVCPWCCGTLFTLFGMLEAYGLKIITHLEWQLLLYYFLTVCGCSIVTGLTWTIYLTINSKKQYYDNAQKFYYNANRQIKEERNNGEFK